MNYEYTLASFRQVVNRKYPPNFLRNTRWINQVGIDRDGGNFDRGDYNVRGRGRRYGGSRRCN